jgi:hypothetical protein
MSNGPKTLFGDDTTAQIEKVKAEHERLNFELKQKVPGALSFPDRPISPRPVEQSKIKPLDLSHVSAPVPAPHAAPNPGALFDTKPVPWVSGAIKLAHEKFSALGPNLESVERQIKALLPLNITTVITWGEPTVSEEAAFVTKAAALLKQFSELRGNELCENALKASTAAPTGFFQKLAGHTSVLGYKPNLIALKAAIISMLPQATDYYTKMNVLHVKLAVNLAALSSVADAVGTIEDSSLSMAIDNRRRLLAQCVQQSDLTSQQLNQMKNLLIQNMSQCSQLLDVTIPAVETANATR